MTRPFRKIFIHPETAGSPLAKRVTERLPGVPSIVTTDPRRELDQDAPGIHKDVLFITRHRGKFLKPCPGTGGYLCCGYQVLNLAAGCPLDCSYCILQVYLNRPSLALYANWEDSLRELDALLRSRPGRPVRLGTGELSDSLALDHLTDLSQELIPQILEHPGAVLELKTKTAAVSHLLDLDPRGRVIVSWSVNAAEVIKSEERGAPLLKTRLRAAVECIRAGYRVGLHFDPLVRFEGWGAAYRRAVEEIFDRLPPQGISWISLGTLRYPPALDAVIRERFPESHLPLEELVPGLDGKLRYFLPLRIEIYRKLVREIRRHAPEVPLYLCMESPEVWSETLGWTPSSSRAVSHQLDLAAMSCPST